MLGKIGEVGDDQCEDKRGSPRRNRMQLRSNLSVTIASNNARRKEGISATENIWSIIHETSKGKE